MKLKTLACLTLVAILTPTLGALAACTLPSGSYVGAGSGPWIVTKTINNTTVSGMGLGARQYTINFGTVANTATTIPASTFGFVGKAVTNPSANPIVSILQNILPYAATATANNTSPTGGQIAAQSVISSYTSAINQKTPNHFNKTSCTGILTMTGTATQVAGTGSPSGVVPATATLTETYAYTVSQSGAVITLSEVTNDIDMIGMSVRLEKQ